MPDVMFTGPEGRLEGRYHQSKDEHAPIALILHPHPQYGGTMNHKVVFSLFHVFVNRGFSVLRSLGDGSFAPQHYSVFGLTFFQLLDTDGDQLPDLVGLGNVGGAYRALTVRNLSR